MDYQLKKAMDPELCKLAQKGMKPELYVAAQLADPGELERFSEKLLCQRTPKRNTVLHVLAQSCDSADAVRHILKRNCCLLMAKNCRGETALHLAARKGHYGIVRELIDYSKRNKGCWFCACFVDRCKRMLRMANVDGNTALHEGVKNNFYEVAKLLVQEDPGFRYRPNHAMETPLYLAVEKGYRDIAELILTTCKSPAYLGPGHKTALHAAAIWNLPELVGLILEKLPNLIIKVDKFGWTALHYAAKLNHPAKLNHEDVVRLLLSAKRSTAYVAARNDDSKTALHIAVIHGHVAVVQELLSHCPDCWEKYTNRRQNILHLAVKYEQKEVLESVLNNSWASELINQRDKRGNTPLHLYVATKILDGSCLVKHPSVDVNSFDNSNSTPLDRILRAAELSQREILIKDELEQAGGARGYRNVATVKKNLRGSSPDKVKGVEKLADTYSIVATLIVTVTFAACFTVPGGYNDDKPDEGMAVLGQQAAFITFVISDFLAMIASINAVLGHLKVVRTKNYRNKLAAVRVIRFRLSQAVTFMMIAFLTGFYAVLHNLAIMIVLCVLAAWLCLNMFITPWLKREADYSAFIGPVEVWRQDFTEAED
ncbi:ankyrin repeat-containing protein At5g02620-like [Coffea eugenioides]|uniref:ankyrin repeat-containing protein At5g02620-like n=1 Tax=Coffea eugenioides TaxID=49369 RepID=UPI000F606125|nr:ankyrin repeat-containing protein At5g02620-like [Coffea eugenioides]